MTADENNLYIGMLSGTSRDGVDLALMSFKEDWPALQQTLCLPYPPELVAILKEMIDTGQRPAKPELRRADSLLVNFFSLAVHDLLTRAGVEAAAVTAIGSHGQTVWHDPDGANPESIQLGDPQRIARQTGIVTVGDFRRADLNAGGQGAPLAPLLHRALFRPAAGRRVVLNLGGIANISVISSDDTVTGFDTGPANCLLDAWVQEQLDQPFDRAGAWSAGGTVDNQLLLECMLDPYFKKPPPKSTGVEHFNLEWLRKRNRVNELEPRDVQATLAQLTATTAALAIGPYEPLDLLVCGGGVNNHDLMDRLRKLVPDCPVLPTNDQGLDANWVEAVLFAWLARERISQRLQDTGKITGAMQPVLLGEIFTPG